MRKRNLHDWLCPVSYRSRDDPLEAFPVKLGTVRSYVMFSVPAVKVMRYITLGGSRGGACVRSRVCGCKSVRLCHVLPDGPDYTCLVSVQVIIHGS